LLLAAGCATPPPPTWAKPGVAATDADKARTDCEYQADLATQQTDSTMRGGLAAVMDRRMRRNDLLALCMRQKGFEPSRR
jgi:hypothetical protein